MTKISTSSLPALLQDRCRRVNDHDVTPGCEYGLYWMATAVRADENPALSVAATMANELNIPLLVYHGLSERYDYASDRLHTFILQGARDVQRQLQAQGVAYVFYLERGNHEPVLRQLASRAAFVVTEDMPVDPPKSWRSRLAATLAAPLIAVDTACVLPMRLVPKAYTRAFQFRKATEADRTGRLPDRIPEVWPKKSMIQDSLPFQSVDLQAADISELVATCEIDHTIGPIPHTIGGSVAGYARWNDFREHQIHSYHKRRNNALLDGVSRMSAYLHFGMVAPQRLAREAAEMGGDGAEKFLDELLIWRELAYAFCFHKEDHDQISAIPDWAQQTLREHESDDRPQIFSWESLARGQTGDALWDAAQASLLVQGELHNNVRMTWGKQFLNWTNDAESALRWMVDLNHRYALDGRDPASYGGLLWCLGQFDRPFNPPEPIIGTVRPRPTQDHAQRLDPESYRARTTRPYTTPMPRIAIVGAGISGLTCARTLFDHGYQVQLFEKSRGFGGRMATRRADLFHFDHGAQYFTVRDARFRRYVESWQQDGVVSPWDGRIAVLGKSSATELAKATERYVALPGMNALAKHLGNHLPVRFQTRIGQIEPTQGAWHVLSDQAESLGEFDFVVFAIPAAQAADLLPAGKLQERASHCEMNPCWAAMFGFTESLRAEYDAAFVHNSPISWIARNGSKPARPAEHEAWVVHANPEWSLRHDGESQEAVAELLRHEFASVIGKDMPSVAHSAAHFWRYAIPTSPLTESCLFDGELRIAACGDWCAGPRVEGAFLSGAAAAGQIMGHYNTSWTAKPVALGD